MLVVVVAVGVAKGGLLGRRRGRGSMTKLEGELMMKGVVVGKRKVGIGRGLGVLGVGPRGPFRRGRR